ncbi:MAG: TRAP transporter substrate-binding protein [Rhodospirillaceae bacterium]|nr:TRAP transporter substrate-binding protein [Rhodospirillaceae bacterium]
MDLQRAASCRIALKAGAFALALAWTGTAAAEATKLKFAATISPASSLVKDVFVPWAARVAAASSNAVQVEVVGGPTLANPLNVYSRVVNGVADIGWAVHGATGVPFPKTGVINLPFEVNDAVAGSVALWRLFETGVIADEYKDVVPLALVAPPPSGIHAKKKVATIADMKGMKVRAADRISASVIGVLGGSAISVAAPETYQSLSRGVVEAAVMPWSGVTTFKLQEVTAYHLDVSLGSIPGMVFMGRRTFEALPAAAQAAIKKESGASFSLAFGKWFESFSAGARETVKKQSGQSVYALEPAELARWKQALAGIETKWVADTPNGKAVLAALRAELAKAGQR